MWDGDTLSSVILGDAKTRYDICTDTKAGQKRLRQLTQSCQRVGQWVQKSVCECTVDEVRDAGLVRTLSRIMDKSEDNNAGVRIGPSGASMRT